MGPSNQEYIAERTQHYNALTEKYKAAKGIDTITIPIRDYLIAFDALNDVCYEYEGIGAPLIDEFYMPVNNKQYEEHKWLYEEE